MQWPTVLSGYRHSLKPRYGSLSSVTKTMPIHAETKAPCFRRMTWLWSAWKIWRPIGPRRSGTISGTAHTQCLRSCGWPPRPHPCEQVVPHVQSSPVGTRGNPPNVKGRVVERDDDGNVEGKCEFEKILDVHNEDHLWNQMETPQGHRMAAGGWPESLRANCTMLPWAEPKETWAPCLFYYGFLLRKKIFFLGISNYSEFKLSETIHY